MSTTKLYDNDSYTTGFTAEVLECIKKDSSYEIVLDRTQFFPEEGGQTPDLGMIDGINVMDVQIRDNVIYHTIDRQIEIGTTITGEVDWSRRFSNMQQHSGEHIFSGIVNRLYGYDNVGFHLSDSIVTMDYNGSFDMKKALEIEQMVNEAIALNIETIITWPSGDELKTINYRSKKELEGPVRIVTFPGYDVCACCAPHVRRTGEIGLLKVVGLINYKGGVRVSILCGQRAMKLFDFDHELITSVAENFSTSPDKICDSIKKLRETNLDSKAEILRLSESLIKYRLAEISDELSNVCIIEREADQNMMRGAVNQLMQKHAGICLFLSGDEEKGYSYIAGSSSLDTRKFGKALSEKFSAKGGGSEKMIQGKLPPVSLEEIKSFTENYEQI